MGCRNGYGQADEAPPSTASIRLQRVDIVMKQRAEIPAVA